MVSELLYWWEWWDTGRCTSSSTQNENFLTYVSNPVYQRRIGEELECTQPTVSHIIGKTLDLVMQWMDVWIQFLAVLEAKAKWGSKCAFSIATGGINSPISTYKCLGHSATNISIVMLAIHCAWFTRIWNSCTIRANKLRIVNLHEVLSIHYSWIRQIHDLRTYLQTIMNNHKSISWFWINMMIKY